MITIFLRMLALFGTMQVVYLYTRNKFQWDTSDFSKFTTADTAICLTGIPIAETFKIITSEYYLNVIYLQTGGLATLLVMKVFNVGDAIIGIFSAIGFVISNLCFAAAQDGWIMYFGMNLFPCLLIYFSCIQNTNKTEIMYLDLQVRFYKCLVDL